MDNMSDTPRTDAIVAAIESAVRRRREEIAARAIKEREDARELIAANRERPLIITGDAAKSIAALRRALATPITAAWED